MNSSQIPSNDFGDIFFPLFSPCVGIDEKTGKKINLYEVFNFEWAWRLVNYNGMHIYGLFVFTETIGYVPATLNPNCCERIGDSIDWSCFLNTKNLKIIRFPSFQAPFPQYNYFSSAQNLNSYIPGVPSQVQTFQNEQDTSSGTETSNEAEENENMKKKENNNEIEKLESKQ